jgi:hypothetical protein
MRTRPLVLAIWTFATGRRSVAEAGTYWQAQRSAVERAYPVAAAMLSGKSPDGTRAYR